MPLPNEPAFPPPPENAQEFPGVPMPPEMIEALRNAGPPPSQLPGNEHPFRNLLNPPHPELDRAIESGDADRVLGELAEARTVFNPDATLNSAITRAIECGRVDIMRLLIQSGVPVNTDNLESAAISGQIPLLAHLMEHFSWPIDQMSDHGLTLLTLAVEHQDMVVWLLSQGADINREDAYSETALSRAVQKGSKNVVTLLLEAGADVTRGAPLQAALLRKENNMGLELMEELLIRGAPVHKFAGENSPIWEDVGFEQMTALHVACDGCHRNIAAVRLLLAHGADPRLNMRLPGGELPNTSAFDSAKGRGYTDITAVMQEHMNESSRFSKSHL